MIHILRYKFYIQALASYLSVYGGRGGHQRGAARLRPREGDGLDLGVRGQGLAHRATRAEQQRVHPAGQPALEVGPGDQLVAPGVEIKVDDVDG